MQVYYEGNCMYSGIVPSNNSTKTKFTMQPVKVKWPGRRYVVLYFSIFAFFAKRLLL
jgi:hypothetical protein